MPSTYCTLCGGTARVADGTLPCGTCGGRGSVNGQTCGPCWGSGNSGETRYRPCHNCNATGLVSTPDKPTPTRPVTKPRGAKPTPPVRKTKAGQVEAVLRFAIFAVTAWLVFDRYSRHAGLEPWLALGLPVVAGVIAQVMWKLIVIVVLGGAAIMFMGE